MLLLLALGALVVIGSLLIGAIGMSQQRDENQEVSTGMKLERARAALIAFAGAQNRLPCPANPNANTGLADNLPATPQTCDSPMGTLPWNSLGLSADDSLDGWGRKISYRVFAGNTGFTQADGMSMKPCDTDNGLTAPTPVSVTGLCAPDHNSTPAMFMAGKGLQGADFGVLHTDYAFVLVSHGATGYGAFGANGIASGNVPTAGGVESQNAQVGPYIRQIANNRNIPATSIAHYDDIVIMMTMLEVATAAGFAAPNWPE